MSRDLTSIKIIHAWPAEQRGLGLFTAITHDKFDLFLTLLKLGYHPNVTDGQGQTLVSYLITMDKDRSKEYLRQAIRYGLTVDQNMINHFNERDIVAGQSMNPHYYPEDFWEQYLQTDQGHRTDLDKRQELSMSKDISQPMCLVGPESLVKATEPLQRFY